MTQKFPAFPKIVLTDTHKSVGVLLLCFGALSFSFLFVFLPALKHERLLSQNIVAEQKGLSKAQKAYSAEFLEVGNQVNAIKSKLGYAKNTLLWEKDITKFLSVLTRLASGLPIEFVSLKPEPSFTVTQLLEKLDKKESAPPVGIILTQLPISVILKSDYNNVVEFLRRVEEGDKFIKIDSLNIEAGESKSTKLMIVMTLDIFADENKH